MNSSDWNSTTSRVGLIFRDREEGTRTFLGSCFCLVDPGLFVTAAHCVRDAARERLWINHHGGPPPDLFTPVDQVEFVPQSDIAVLRTPAPGSKWVQPFVRAQFWTNLGDRICAFGYPIQAIDVEAPVKETGRFFRGNVQRPFLHTTHRVEGQRYHAYELSFPCPHGLSGGPVFLEEDPTTIIGVITEDLEVGTLLTEEDIEQEAGRVTKRETRRVIQYGVAESIFDAVEVIERVLGRQLPTSGAT